ncbi:MAG: hypothetical protein ACOCTQ_03445, partial [Planctomycetota bacterium]
RERYRILDFERLAEKLEARDFEEVREAYCGLIEERAEGQRQVREARWSEPVAVGSEGFVREVGGKLGRRRRIEVRPVGGEEENTWHAREVSPSYSRFQGGENRL